MEATPWYKDGLRFECTACGKCCTGPPGFVWVNKSELEAIAEHIGKSVKSVINTHARRVGVRYSLKERANGDCVFLDPQTRGCTVYSVRPRQCRSWPFWQSNLSSEEHWKATCDFCPGAGTGKLVPLHEVEKQAAMIRI